MKKNQFIIAASFVSTFVLALTLFAISSAKNDIIVPVAEIEKEVTLSKSDFLSVQLEEYKHPQARNSDRKFRIPLSNNCYIDGLLLFDDCDFQSVGETLGDGFVIDNSNEENDNAFNFNILLSVTNASYFTFEFEYTASKGNDPLWTRCGGRAGVPDESNVNLYSFANQYTYQQLVNNYDRSIEEGINPQDSQIYDYDQDDQFDIDFEEGTYVFQSDFDDEDRYSVINMFINGEIDDGNKLTFTLKNIYISYKC